MNNNLKLFGLGKTQDAKHYVQRIAKFLGYSVSKHQEETFSDGEVSPRSLENVRNHDCYVVSSLYSDEKETVNEKIVKLQLLVGALKDASARRVTIVAPYLAYQRQDRKIRSRESISTKYLAMTMEAVGADRLLTMDVHNLSAFQNAHRLQTDNLEAKNLLADYICGGIDKNGVPIEFHLPEPLIEDPDNLAVVSPDAGSVARCRQFRDAMEKRLKTHNQIEVSYIDKRRVTGNEVQGGKVIGDVANKRVIILDDMISTGGSIDLCVKAVEDAGGQVHIVAATHGLFVGNANQNLKKVNRLVVTDTIAPFRLDKDQWKGRLSVVRTAEMFGEAIKRTHFEGGSISELLE